MTRLGFKKISFDINEDLLFEIDSMPPNGDRMMSYKLNEVIEQFFRIKVLIAKDALKAFGSKMTEEEKKLWASL